MTIYSGPGIVTQGLLLNYDLSNTKKSYKGQPATNLLGYSDSLNGGSWSGYCAGNMSNVVYKTTDVVDPFGGFNATKVTMDGSTGCGAGGTWGFLWGAGGLSSGVTYTASIYARADRQTSFTLGINDSSGSGKTVTTEWQRFTHTYTTGATDRGLQVIRGDSTSGIKIYFYGAQLEVGSSATPYISAATSATSRSSSQVIFDLTGTNSITMSGSPTYNSNSITFPNINTAYIGATTPANFRMGTQNFTLSAWVKQLDNGTNCLLESRGDSLAGYFWILNYPSTGQISVFLNYGGSQYIYGSTITTLTSGTIQNIVAVVDRTNSQIIFYVNGVLWNTVTGTHTQNISPSGGDRYYTGYDLGGGTQNYELYSYMHYNRALSASEVLQNFNALRGRYGV